MVCEIWIEKYRPKSLKDVVGNEEIVYRLRSIAFGGNMPHILLAGPPGTGKTSSVHSLAHELLGQHYSKAVMELNASDERGIDTVRNQIKSFAKEIVTVPANRHKIIILDEVDSMTETAQHALRRLMEVYSESTRFALACNQSTKVIEAIQSRCAILRFGRLKDEHILKRLIHICKEEKVDYVPSGMDALVFTSEGDMRNAINNLQSVVQGFGTVNRDSVLKVCDLPAPDSVRAILSACKNANWREAHDISSGLIEQGYTPSDICTVIRSVLRNIDLPEHVLLEFLKETARSQFVMSDGCPTILQLDKLLCNLCMICLKT